jgi:hypothetical protein
MARAEGGCLMRRTPRFLVVAFPVVLVVAAFWLRPESSRPFSAPPPTIEPTLPLALDLRASPADSRTGQLPRLEATLDSSADLQDVTLSLILPEDLVGDAGGLPTARGTSLRAGEQRVYTVPVRARRDGAFPIRLEATFRLPDGRVFHTQQGILWRSGAVAPEGQHHAGAYEWMGVPVEEPQP